MKILFLDVDGVLNHYGSSWIDDECLALVLKIIRETGAAVVLSSDWKDIIIHPDLYGSHDVNRVNWLLHRSGLPFIGMTPDIDPDHRELEIAAWLEARQEPVESFAILDDLYFGFPAMFPGRFVKTSGMPGHGLTKQQAEATIAILNGNNPSRSRP